MIKTLMKIRIKAMFAGASSTGKKKITTGKKVLFGILAIYAIVVFGALFGGLFYSICEPFTALGLSWLYFGFMGVMVLLLCFIGSVFVTQNQLYDAKDNDMLLSMPIPPKQILLSRIAALVGLNYIYEALVVIPGGVVYCLLEPVTFLGVLFFIIGFLLLPLLVIALSAIFGWLIALANTKMRNKNTITMILTLILFLAYMYFCLKMQDYITQLIANGSQIGEAIRTGLPPFYHLGKAIADGNIISFIIFMAFCIVPFVIVYYVLSVTFIKLATTNRGQKKIKYKEKTMKTSSIKKALLVKEAKRFFGNPMYMFNAGIGLVFLVIGAVYVMIKKDDITNILSMFGQGHNFIGPALCAIAAMMCAMTIISAPTISLEGRTLWICKSIPVETKDVLICKAGAHILISLPFIIVSAILVVMSLELGIISQVMIFLFPTIVTIFNGLFGVIINLKYPKFDWINETAAIKQGMAPFLALMVSMATIAAPMICYYWISVFISNLEIYLLIVFAAFVVGSALEYKYLVTKGVKIFNQLQN